MNATHPSKEQVRAYLSLRKGAHLPPPSPEEIRRRLDWRVDDVPHPAVSVAFLPPTLLQLGALMAFACLITPFSTRQKY